MCRNKKLLFTSLISRLNSNEKEPIVEEKPFVNSFIANGIDNEINDSRSRSPSPTLELPMYNVADGNYNAKNTQNQYTYSTSSLSDSNTNMLNDSYLLSDDKQISQILKEANNLNSIHQNNIQENKIKVSLKF